MKKLTLLKLLQSQGFGSRKECLRLIRSGEVRLGGEAVKDPDFALDPEGLRFQVAGEEWDYRANVYLALHKPAGFECSRKPSHHPGVLTLLPDPLLARNVQPAGRLDHDTTGLLILSDDGTFIHAMTSPKRHVGKLYEATVVDPVTDTLIATLLGGVQLHDEPAPLFALHARRLGEKVLELIIDQGKYHQVKRMLAAAGNPVAALKRTAIGALTLADLDLSEGEWCYLDAAQQAQIFAPMPQLPTGEGQDPAAR